MNTVFHRSTDDPNLHRHLVRNVANLLSDDNVPVETVVVTNGGDVDLLLEDSPEREQVARLWPEISRSGRPGRH